MGLDGSRTARRSGAVELGNLTRYGLRGPDGVRRATMRQISRNTPAVSNRCIHPGAPMLNVTAAQTSNMTTARTVYGSMAGFWIARGEAPVVASNQVGYGEIYFLSR